MQELALLCFTQANQKDARPPWCLVGSYHYRNSYTIPGVKVALPL